MRHLDLFSGICGFALAARWMGWHTVQFVKIDLFCQKIIKKNFPGVPIHGDIKTFKYEGQEIDIITGGFPCQPFSHAGKRKGTDDNRYLWPEMLRVIREFRPRWVVGENVAGIISMENGRTLDRILTDLEDSGYNTETFLIPACSVGAWHRRDRIWIVGYKVREPERSGSKSDRVQNVSDTISERRCSRNAERQYGENVGELRRSEINGYWNSEPNMGGMVTGLSDWMDGYWDQEPERIPRVATGIKNRVDRLKGLGNAIVPQIAYQLFKAIKEIDFNKGL